MNDANYARFMMELTSIRRRFNWLDEYFYFWQKKMPAIFKIIFRCPTPRYAMSFYQQTKFFMARLRGHFMIIQLGSFWEMRFSSACSYRFHNRDLAEMKILLWESGLPVAWIHETGKQISGIMERALTYRWSTII